MPQERLTDDAKPTRLAAGFLATSTLGALITAIAVGALVTVSATTPPLAVFSAMGMTALLFIVSTTIGATITLVVTRATTPLT